MRPVRALAAFALTLAVLGTGLSAAPGAQAIGAGTLTVHVVDEHGDPLPGSIMVIDGSDGIGTQLQQVTEMSVDLPPGEYGVLSVSPWGGILCAGFDTCDYVSIASGLNHPDGSLVVAQGQETDVELAADYPVRLTGRGRVGRPLVLSSSEGFANLGTYLGGVGGGLYSPTVEWLRDGDPITGADDHTYVPTPGDVGSRISARLSYTALGNAQFVQLTGQPVTPRTTQTVKVDKVPTAAFTRMLRSKITTAQRGVARVDATAKDMIVTGRATVRVGGWSVTRSLRNGRLTVRLPALKPGTYQVASTYAGSRVFASSAAKIRTLVVKRK